MKKIILITVSILFFKLFSVAGNADSLQHRGLSLNLTELVPLGGLARVNLSNLRQSSGRIRIESCPVYDGDLRDGRLIRDRTFQFHGDVTEQRTIQP